MSFAVALIICSKKYSRALGKKKVTEVCVVKFLKLKTRTSLCFELKCSVQRVCTICEGKMLYFSGTKGCSHFLNTLISDRPSLCSAGDFLYPNDD